VPTVMFGSPVPPFPPLLPTPFPPAPPFAPLLEPPEAVGPSTVLPHAESAATTASDTPRMNRMRMILLNGRLRVRCTQSGLDNTRLAKGRVLPSCMCTTFRLG